MAPIIASCFDDQKIILMPQFFAQIDHQKDRTLHSHNCIEMSYIASGTANHILVRSDGKTEQQKISKGNYVILDSTAHHAYRNASDDFKVLNVLFKIPFLWKDAADSRGMNASKSLAVTRSEYNDDERANGIELKFGLNKPKALKNKKYVRLWLDLKGENKNIDFSKANIGLIANNDYGGIYTSEGQSCRTTFYYLREGETKWVKMNHGKGGFGTLAGASVKGFKGWFAFPIDEMIHKDTGNTLSAEDVITGVYFYYTMSDREMAGNYVYINDISLVEDYRDTSKELNDKDDIISFDESVLRLSVTGKDGDTTPEAKVEQIKVSIFDDSNFYEIIKEMFPHFDYKKIDTTPVNQVYFDKNGNIFPLFMICHDSSRKNMHDWWRTVRHALSLIIILSLYSYDEYIRPKKESIIDIIKNCVEKRYAEPITLTEICSKHFYSVAYVSHKFKSEMNCSFEQYLRQVRINHAGELLLSSSLSVNEIAEKCGYSSVRSFRKAFNVVYGVSPLEFKKKYNK